MYFLQFPSHWHFIFICWIPFVSIRACTRIKQLSLCSKFPCVPACLRSQQGSTVRVCQALGVSRTLPACPLPSLSSARATAASSLVCPRRYGHGDSTDCGSGAIMKYLRPKRLVLVLISRLGGKRTTLRRKRLCLFQASPVSAKHLFLRNICLM